MSSVVESPETAMEFCALLDRRTNRYIELFQQWKVLPESPIDLVDKRLSYRSFQETVAMPIMSAIDHLRLVTSSVLSWKGTLPFAHATPLRTAITAASMSLWAMHDEPDERFRRAVLLNYHDFSNSLKFFNSRPEEKIPDIGVMRDKTRLRMDYFAVEAAKFGVDVTVRSWKLTADFGMVTAAAKMMSPWSDGWKPEVEVPSQWRMLSGYAHGLRWAAAPDTEQSEVDEIGFASTTVTFDIDRLMESARIVSELIETAIARYRNLAGHPESLFEF
jgi:hypothetical protein